jgi:hypothetical protein
MNDERTIFATEFMGYASAGILYFPSLPLPAGDLIFATSDILVQCDIEALDEMGPISLD